jgi:hypothetical protein
MRSSSAAERAIAGAFPTQVRLTKKAVHSPSNQLAMKGILLVVALLIGVSAGNASGLALPVKAAADSVYVCQSRSAYAYHAYECRGLSRCTHVIVKIAKAQAIKLGYRACKICYR